VSPHFRPILTRSFLFAVVFFGLFLFFVYQMGRILMVFLSPLLWAAILTLVLYPLQERIAARLKHRRGLAAAIMTLITLLLVIGPAVSLLFVLVTQAGDLYNGISAFVQSGKLSEAWEKINGSFLDKILLPPVLRDIDIKGMVAKGIGDLSSGLAAQLGGVLKNFVIFTIDVVIMLIALFFFLRDGKSYFHAFIDLLPFTKPQKEEITRKFIDTFGAVINGVFLVALLQGAMTGIGFALFGIPLAVFWGFLAALLALVPVGGAALIWLPGAAYLYFSGSVLSGILLGVWGLVLVSLPDNILRPLLIGRKADIPTFILFIALLGGLQVYGFLGLLFGPLVVTLLTALVQIYREEYAGKTTE
jgi:predicted PurR-regulated permease PerM